MLENRALSFMDEGLDFLNNLKPEGPNSNNGIKKNKQSRCNLKY